MEGIQLSGPSRRICLLSQFWVSDALLCEPIRICILSNFDCPAFMKSWHACLATSKPAIFITAWWTRWFRPRQIQRYWEDILEFRIIWGNFLTRSLRTRSWEKCVGTDPLCSLTCPGWYNVPVHTNSGRRMAAATRVVSRQRAAFWTRSALVITNHHFWQDVVTCIYMLLYTKKSLGHWIYVFRGCTHFSCPFSRIYAHLPMFQKTQWFWTRWMKEKSTKHHLKNMWSCTPLWRTLDHLIVGDGGRILWKLPCDVFTCMGFKVQPMTLDPIQPPRSKVQFTYKCAEHFLSKPLIWDLNFGVRGPSQLVGGHLLYKTVSNLIQLDFIEIFYKKHTPQKSLFYRIIQVSFKEELFFRELPRDTAVGKDGREASFCWTGATVEAWDGKKLMVRVLVNPEAFRINLAFEVLGAFHKKRTTASGVIA